MTDQRTYQRTHPHIDFAIDLRKAPHTLWMLLGEAQSKVEHIAGVPLRPDVAKWLHQVYLAKGALATTAIEGNTLSEEEAIKRVEGELSLPPSREYLGQEIDNIVSAANGIFRRLLAGEDAVLRYERVLDYNKQVLNNLPLNEGVEPGQVRTHDVGVGGYHGAPPQDCEHLLRRMCEWLNDDSAFRAPPGQEIAFSIIKAVVAHLYIAWIHPFGDGNGRTARLVEFQVLASSGVPLPAAHLLSDHYNRTRSEYYRQLAFSSREADGPLRFLLYAVQGFVDSLKEQLEAVRAQQMDVTWRNYVHETLAGDSAVKRRRRHLVLDLAAHRTPVSMDELAGISPTIAKCYATIGQRTLARDVSELVERGYLLRVDHGVAANTARIAAFLPARRVS